MSIWRHLRWWRKAKGPAIKPVLWFRIRSEWNWTVVLWAANSWPTCHLNSCTRIQVLTAVLTTVRSLQEFYERKNFYIFQHPTTRLRRLNNRKKECWRRARARTDWSTKKVSATTTKITLFSKILQDLGWPTNKQ